jgi:hypothetical protein
MKIVNKRYFAASREVSSFDSTTWDLGQVLYMERGRSLHSGWRAKRFV